jgi:hypothetical protein
MQTRAVFKGLLAGMPVAAGAAALSPVVDVSTLL